MVMILIKLAFHYTPNRPQVTAVEAADARPPCYPENFDKIEQV